MNKGNKIILIIIFLGALFLRIYKLGQYPVGFLWDEAALGYNAYSILETGRDEYGKFLPMIFKSFGDYKPGIYVYLTVPSVAIFGLNEFATRLPSALFGAMTVFFLYFLVKEGLDLEKKEKKNEIIALISSMILAFNPWNINFSRGAWELNVMLFEIILAIYLLFHFLNNQKKLFLFGSAITFVLSLFTYQSAKFLAPALLVGIIFFFKEKVKSVKKKEKIIFLLIFLTGFLVFNMATFIGGKGGRLKVMSIFSYPRSSEEKQMILNQDNQNNLDFAVFHSSPIFFVRSIFGRYFNHFSGKFLFFYGDWSNPRNGTVYHGILYLFDILFLILGLVVLFSHKRKQMENFMIFWLLLAPLPSALTRDSISAVRSFPMVIPLVFLVAGGIYGFLEYLKGKKPFFRYIILILFFAIYFLFFVRFLDFYFVHDKNFSSENRLYGYKEMVNYISPLVKAKNTVNITNKYGQPYIFYLFYTKYDPLKYQKQSLLTENPYGDVGEVERIDNIEFKKIYFPEDKSFGNSLFVGDEFELPSQDIIGQEGINFTKEIKFFNNKTAFRIVETN